MGKIKRLECRLPREAPAAPGLVWAIDFWDFPQDAEAFKSVMLFTDRASGFVFPVFLKDRHGPTIKLAIEEFLAHIKRQFNFEPREFQHDAEVIKSREVRDWLESLGIISNTSAANTQQQNGGAERMGGVLKTKAAVMRAEGRLPHHLWKEIYTAAVYLHNRTPREANAWSTPYETFFRYTALRDGIATPDRKPKLNHLRSYGCRAYAMTSDAQTNSKKLLKLKPKAWVGYLVGYVSTNIFRIWIPSRAEVISSRDVVFNENEFFSGNKDELRDDLAVMDETAYADLLNSVALQEPSRGGSNIHAPQVEDDETSPFITTGEVIEEEPAEPTTPAPPPPPPAPQAGTDHPYTEARFEALLSPEATPPPPACMIAVSFREPGQLEVGTKGEEPRAAGINREERPVVGENNCEEQTPNRTHEVTDERSIRRRYGPWEAAFLAGRHAAIVGALRGIPVTKLKLYRSINRGVDQGQPRSGNAAPPNRSRSGSAAPSHRSQTEGAESPHRSRTKTAAQSPVVSDEQARAPAIATTSQKRYHRRDLPPPPSSTRDMASHPFKAWFTEAEEAHLQSHREMKSWVERQKSDAGTTQILDCMWVRTYKFDKHGFLLKAKARLVVRGDQQAHSILENTYASTLAGRSFRTLMAIAARFDLDLIQYDVVNAFVHADLPTRTFMRAPPGHRKPGRILELKKALYGLRESPLLWQEHFTESLISQGFEQVPHESCCFVKDDFFLFFYVDDIVVACPRGAKEKAHAAIDRLRERYTLQGGEDLQWFLGMEVIRDREKRLIWLSQSEYFKKIANLASTKTTLDLDDGPDTPMTGIELLPHEDVTEIPLVRLFQRKTGSMLYGGCITRPDVAFASSRLSRFNNNPGPKHHRAADRVLRYLGRTHAFALQLGGGNDFETYSDASFADNTVDRRSSQAYVMKLFGGVVGWRANKQDTVTTSTTEAELLALAQAAKEALFASRLLRELGVTLEDSSVKLWCDNTQTLRLLHKQLATLQTRLRHVDIHNHWLREAIQDGRITAEYKPTGEMLADGLTKALGKEAFERFRDQMGIVDITEKLKERKTREITMEDLQGREDVLEGGESSLVYL